MRIDAPPASRAPASRPLGTTSLVLGVAGLLAGWTLLGAPSIAAVVLGHLSLGREPAGRGLATAGLVLGYSGIAIALLGGVLIAIALTLPFAFLATFPVLTGL